MGKRNSDSPQPDLSVTSDVKRIKIEISSPKLISVKKELENKPSVKIIKTEVMPEPISIMPDDATSEVPEEQKLAEQTTLSDELLELLPNAVVQDLGDGRVVYVLHDTDRNAVNSETCTAEENTLTYMTDENGVNVLSCAETVSEDAAVLQVENDDQQCTSQSLSLENIDIKSTATDIVYLLQTQGLIKDGTVIKNILLQGVDEVDPEKSLAAFCVSATGCVQVDLEIWSFLDGSIAVNIVDIIHNVVEDVQVQEPATRRIQRQRKEPSKRKNVEMKAFTRSDEFDQIRAMNNIPEELFNWSTENVQTWLTWASYHFDLSGLSILDVTLNGNDLTRMEINEILHILQISDSSFAFHLSVLKNLNLVGLIDNHTKISTGRGNRTGNNGQIQLWQFLLELLIDRSSKRIISWVGNNGEFAIKDHNLVASLWGQRKNKSGMTYDKMSRAMRYYYDSNMIRKVPGKKFTYQFVCDLQSMVGYSAGQINEIVNYTEDGSNESSDLFLLEKVKEALRTPGAIKKVPQQTNEECAEETTECRNIYQLEYAS